MPKKLRALETRFRVSLRSVWGLSSGFTGIVRKLSRLAPCRSALADLVPFFFVVALLLLRGERDSEKRQRVQAENDARRAKAAADQAAAAAAAASRSLKLGEKQSSTVGKAGEVNYLDSRVLTFSSPILRRRALVGGREREKGN